MYLAQPVRQRLLTAPIADQPRSQKGAKVVSSAVTMGMGGSLAEVPEVLDQRMCRSQNKSKQLTENRLS
jgi:hypothetical protein